MKYIAVVILCLSFAVATQVDAAKLYVRTDKPIYLAGQTGFATLNVDSQGGIVNAVAAEIAYDPLQVEVTKTVTDEIVIGVWARKPGIANDKGIVSLEGAILNPGYIGDRGRLIGFEFKVKKAGVISFEPKNYRVFANDGKATRLPATAEKKTVPAIAAGNYIKAASATNPDQRVWYKAASASLSWSPEKDITAIAYAFNQTGNSEPATEKTTTLRSAGYKNLASGSWYAHIKAKHATYGWLPAAHFRINIDNEAPVFASVVAKRVSDAFLPVLDIVAQDRFSGMARIEIWVNGLKLTEVKAATLTGYKLSKLKTGANNVEVRAFDKLGNQQVKKLAFAFKPLK